MRKNIEVEVRSLLSEAGYRRVKSFLKKHARYLGSHRDQNTYFDREGRLRISVEPYGAFLKFNQLMGDAPPGLIWLGYRLISLSVNSSTH